MKFLVRFVLNNIPRPVLIRLSYVFNKISKFWYRGNNVECNICGSTYSKMLPYGYINVRQNALCPNCLSLERHRLIWLYLHEETNIITDKNKILHIAPEQCFFKRFKKLENLDYVTADIESPLADFKCDIQDMPFKENEFDMVMCNHVLEHVDDDKKAMKEILRVLKPGGFAILLVPQDFEVETTFEDPSITDPKERNKVFGQYDHVRLYGRDYPNRLKEQGFEIPETNFLDTIPQDKRERYCLLQKEFMFGYKKPLK
ncbi:MAG: methyltransferase domain-containing protein [Bacteroidales bacterium]|nr:methyltransferase domain-containing protein [Bacteroidales bacterium]